MNIRSFLLTLNLLFFPLVLLAQEEKTSAFLMESLTYKFHPKWSVYVELQQRSMEDIPTPDYYEFKGGLTYFITPNHQPFIGLGRYVTYADREVSKQEFRMWAQYVFVHYLNRFKFEHRARAEQRFFYEPQKDVHSTANRYRYRLNVTMPVNKPKLEPKTFYLNTFEEIFFVNDHPTFARNRFYFGGGYQFSPLFSLGMGYLNQKEFMQDAHKIYNMGYLSLNFNIQELFKDSDYHIPVAD